MIVSGNGQKNNNNNNSKIEEFWYNENKSKINNPIYTWYHPSVIIRKAPKFTNHNTLIIKSLFVKNNHFKIYVVFVVFPYHLQLMVVKFLSDQCLVDDINGSNIKRKEKDTLEQTGFSFLLKTYGRHQYIVMGSH